VHDSDTPRPRLHAARDEPDQVLRLLRFRERHPDVTIELDGFWRAVISAQNGETVICRYDLRALLDKLGELLGETP